MNTFSFNFYQALTIINSIVLVILPLVFFRRQKLQGVKYKELMELNNKIHNITVRADDALSTRRILIDKDYNRLGYLISRIKKHDPTLSKKIKEYKDLWDLTISEFSRHGGFSKKVNKTQKTFLKKSEEIRELADKLLE